MPEGATTASDNQTINMLESMKFHLKKLKVENYVKREPNYLFKKHDNSMAKRILKSKSFRQGLNRKL